MLDISLNEEDGANNDGLSLISLLKKEFPNCKIIVVTGYSNSAEHYKSDYDLLLKKMNDETLQPLDKTQLINSIKSLI